MSDPGDLSAQNDPAPALSGCVCTVAEEDRTIALHLFSDAGPHRLASRSAKLETAHCLC
ncbi:hypothetical protein LO771_21150 [Streptacidiphilus sp. ASG 303]|uniref:hypothetical protein n=1 Tax=Streptacidiphilus sp. ASG 303 TaxID=2896847 RepID=UPI001E616F30|nr:hypothetical protein [Streptacidiphilus sp. ASG 303]MCD0484830.1 hypothetical protein [Streptacidiphilus sp. ASG 303]